MIKITLYLPEDLKNEIQRTAQESGCSEAELMRDTLRSGVTRRQRPKPRSGLFSTGDPYMSEKVDELLKGSSGR